MTEHTVTIDSVELISTDEEGVFEFAAYGTADDGTGLMGYGDTAAEAVDDLRANLALAFAPEEPPVVIDAGPAEMAGFAFSLNLGDGMLGAAPDPLA